MDSLTMEKARNPGIIHVLAELLLRYHIRVAVIQGILDPLVIQTVITFTIPLLHSFTSTVVVDVLSDISK